MHLKLFNIFKPNNCVSFYQYSYSIKNKLSEMRAYSI